MGSQKLKGDHSETSKNSNGYKGGGGCLDHPADEKNYKTTKLDIYYYIIDFSGTTDGSDGKTANVVILCYLMNLF